MGREERIAARRQRIKEKLGAQKGEGAGGDGDGSKEDEETRSQAQISDSRARINKLKSNGALEVTKVRIVGDSRENERRINEEVNRQGRRQKLLYEAESSARQNAAVAMKWSALFDKEIPQELFAEIELQRDSCERIIQAKDRLIKEFKAELKAKDALHREESCGGHFREEHQVEGEAQRDDEHYSYVAAWGYTGDLAKPKLNKEWLEYEEVHFSTRSYK